MTSKHNEGPSPQDTPFASPAALAPPHMLSFTIGNYFQMFSHVEFMISVLACRIMNVDITTVQFLWRDAGLRHKTKGTRRAAKEAFGDKDERFTRIHKVLTLIENRSQFRNDLAHGTFMVDANGGVPTMGRPGDSFQQMLANFAPIDAAVVLDEMRQLQDIFKDLGRLISSNFAASSASNSSESLRRNQ